MAPGESEFLRVAFKNDLIKITETPLALGQLLINQHQKVIN